MANVLFDAATGNRVASATTNTFAFTITGGHSNNLLIVGISTGSTVTSVTYNGVSLTQLGSTLSYNAGASKISIWYLYNPPTGSSFNVVATVSAASFIAVTASSLYNANGNFGTLATNSGSGTSSTNTVTTTSNNQMVYDLVDNSAPFADTATSSQTKDNQPASSGLATGHIAATGSNMTETWSFTSTTPWGQMTVAVLAATSQRVQTDGYGGVYV